MLPSVKNTMYETGACSAFGVPVFDRGPVINAPLCDSQAASAQAAAIRTNILPNIEMSPSNANGRSIKLGRTLAAVSVCLVARRRANSIGFNVIEESRY